MSSRLVTVVGLLAVVGGACGQGQVSGGTAGDAGGSSGGTSGGSSSGTSGGTSGASTLKIVTASVPAAALNQPYGGSNPVKLLAQGGAPPYDWAIGSKSSLLSWLSVAPTSGTLSGVPTVATSSASFTVVVTDQASATAEATFTMVVTGCTTGQSQACTQPQGSACYVGTASCANGTLGACTTSAPSTNVQTCGPSCNPCGSTANACVTGLCGCGSGPTCTGGDACCSGADGGVCSDLTSDVANCGACGMACTTTDPNAQPVCSGGLCQFPCTTGWARCGSPTGTCSTNTESDAKNCGGCGNACPQGAPHASAPTTCQSGLCVLACDNGYLNCNGSLTDGCETAMSTQNCGSCGSFCTGAPVLGSLACEQLATGAPYTCKQVCPQNDNLCPQTTQGYNLCVPNTDNGNCGSCGNACSAGGGCVTGANGPYCSGCPGCYSAGACVTGDTLNVCGDNGGLCLDCTTQFGPLGALYGSCKNDTCCLTNTGNAATPNPAWCCNQPAYSNGTDHFCE